MNDKEPIWPVMLLFFVVGALSLGLIIFLSWLVPQYTLVKVALGLVYFVCGSMILGFFVTMAFGGFVLRGWNWISERIRVQ